MSQTRICTLCQQELNTRSFWDNLSVHKDCFDKVLAAVTIQAGEVKVKEPTK